MKIKSVAGVVYFVKDIDKTAEFYEALGFDIKTREKNHLKIYLNWFWIDFWVIEKGDTPAFYEEALLKNKGAGQYLYISVDNVYEFYKGLLAKGLKPSTEPKDWLWGNREFVIRDPDRYKLVFFKKI